MIYVLELEGGFYYVGHSSRTNFSRILDHWKPSSASKKINFGDLEINEIQQSSALKPGNQPAKWTIKHRPIFILGVWNGNEEDENYMTIQMMKAYGINKVRGGQWCKVEDYDEKNDIPELKGEKFVRTDDDDCCSHCHLSGHKRLDKDNHGNFKCAYYCKKNTDLQCFRCGWNGHKIEQCNRLHDCYRREIFYKCYICNSKDHFMAACPNKDEKNPQSCMKPEYKIDKPIIASPERNMEVAKLKGILRHLYEKLALSELNKAIAHEEIKKKEREEKEKIQNELNYYFEDEKKSQNDDKTKEKNNQNEDEKVEENKKHYSLKKSKSRSRSRHRSHSSSRSQGKHRSYIDRHSRSRSTSRKHAHSKSRSRSKSSSRNKNRSRSKSKSPSHNHKKERNSRKSSKANDLQVSRAKNSLSKNLFQSESNDSSELIDEDYTEMLLPGSIKYCKKCDREGHVRENCYAEYNEKTNERLHNYCQICGWRSHTARECNAKKDRDNNYVELDQYGNKMIHYCGRCGNDCETKKCIKKKDIYGNRLAYFAPPF